MLLKSNCNPYAQIQFPSTVPTMISTQPTPLTGRPSPSLNACRPVQSHPNSMQIQLNLQDDNTNQYLWTHTPSTIPIKAPLSPTTGRPAPSLNTCRPVQSHPNSMQIQLNPQD